MKKIFLLITLLLCVHTSWGQKVEVDRIFYYLNTEDKTAEVTFKGFYSDSYNEYSGDVVIPKEVTVNGTVYSVTSLGNSCFADCSGLTSITIPNSVTSLGKYCFEDCSSLTSITIPESVTSFGMGCFQGSGLTSITIPNSVTSLGYFCFSGCSSLTSVTIPNSVTSLGNSCFADCCGLTSVTIPSSVTSIGEGCFQNCSSLTSVTIPNSVTSLEDWCFGYCSVLTSVTIPSSVNKLGCYCFYGCSSLTSITIPFSVTRISELCFANCSSLESITVDDKNPKYDSRENCNAIIETKTNTMISGCKNTVIPPSVTSLGDYCFTACTSLRSINIPSSVTSMYKYCFAECLSLTSITIPASVEFLGEYCFGNCPSLVSIIVDKNNKVFDSRENCNAIIKSESNTIVFGCSTTVIPSSVTGLGKRCFEGCHSLDSIKIPSSVTSLAVRCFWNCSSLKTVTCEIPKAIKGDFFFDTPINQATLYVSEASLESYKTTYPWSGFGTILPITATGINHITANKAANIDAIYNLDGKRSNGTNRGLNIIRMTDGTTKKVMK